MFARIAFCLALAAPAFPASPVFVRTQPRAPMIEVPAAQPTSGVWPAWIPNHGQNQPEVELSTQHGRQPVWTFLRRNGVTTTLYFPDIVERGWVHLDFVDSETAKAATSKPTGARSSYYLGNDASKWLQDVPHFQQVQKRGVWPGVDFIATSLRGYVEYEWRLAPGADPRRIRLEVKDADSVEIAANGDLVFHVRTGEIRHTAPEAFQRFDGKKRFVPVGFEIDEAGRVGFALGAYDPDRELVIDPAIVAQNTLAQLLRRSGYSAGAGSGQDFAAASELNRLPKPQGGNDIYLLMQMGATSSPNNGWGNVNGVRDIYFQATIPDFFSLQDSSFEGLTVGGNGDETPRGLEGGSAHPENGIFHYAAIAQTASNNAPIINPAAAYQTALAGASDAYAIDLDWNTVSEEVRARYSSYVGGPVAENATDADFFLTTTNNECSVFTLSTRSPNLPTRNVISGNLQGIEDVFIFSTCRDAQDLPVSNTATYLPGNGTEAFPQAEHVQFGTPRRDRLWLVVASDSSGLLPTPGLIGGPYVAPGANLLIEGYERTGTANSWSAAGLLWGNAGPGVETPSGIKSVHVANDRWKLNEHWSFNIGFRYEEVGGATTFTAPLLPGTTASNPGGRPTTSRSSTPR